MFAYILHMLFSSDKQFDLSYTFFIQDNIILIGHSAGAHLCALSTLFLVNNAEELFIETNKQRDLVSAIKGIIGKSMCMFIICGYYIMIVYNLA